ncbi:phosphodiester glycosidase family protein [Blautia sp. MSJ-19]|uniref:phosphodiester glycosidase family protein n=1 Tax=Blautia sp. MSJ-19 TaxID=2841517 RepID=UPI001C0F11F7|nr:phosphodiester glycosidase family protein [Blautia sp. MSJ-19]MBU5481723.1 phosphodiester glycosidase family protein [Blautia sp. MSJ-19]
MGYILTDKNGNRIVSPANYAATDEQVYEQLERLLEEGKISGSNNSRDTLIRGISIEYGRLNGSSFYFARIPQFDLEGKKVTPKVAITSADGLVDGAKISALDYAKREKTAFCVNASLFNTNTSKPEGQLVINGVDKTAYKTDSSGKKYAWMDSDMGTAISDTECYPLCIDANGKLSTPYTDRKTDAAQPSALIEAGYKYAVTAWGTIIDNYKSTTADTWDEIVHKDKKVVRQVIGQFQNGDYFVCSFDGIKGAVTVNEAGMDYDTIATFLISKGVRFAYSLDGGGSCETTIGDRQINPIFEGSTGRKVATVIYFSAD